MALLQQTYSNLLVVKRSDIYNRHTYNTVKLQVAKCRTDLAQNSSMTFYV